MSKTYIVYLQERYIEKRSDGEEWLQMPVNVSGHELTIKTVIPLTPYTEPDLDAVRNEAYEKGVQDTNQHWVDAPRSCAYKLGYENGLNELWEAMQKAIKMYCEIDNEVFLRVFHDVKCDWGESVLQALFKNTPQHLIDSIRKYEQEKKKEIQVGDEVITASGKAVVIGVGPVHLEYIYADGSNGFGKVKNAKKTGRHFPEIAEVLRKMQEEKE